MINKNTDYSSRIDLYNKNSSLTKIIDRIKSNSRVLEFGPAKGHMTKVLKKKINCKVVCVEINTDFLNELKPYAEKVIISDIDELDWDKEFLENEKFDAIIFADVLEHLYDPWFVVEKCKSLLKEDGSFFASIPNVSHAGLVGSLLLGNFDYRPQGLLDKTHIRFFTRKSIIGLFENNGYYIHHFEEVILDWRESAFKDDLLDASGNLLELITRSPDSSVYQFFVEAKHMNPQNSIRISELENQVRNLKASHAIAVGKFILWTTGFLIPKFIMRKLLLRLFGKK